VEAAPDMSAPKNARRPIRRGGETVCAAIAMVLGTVCQGWSQDSTRLPNGVIVEETRWGFDGKAQRATFTPLSILLVNPDAKPAGGKLKLLRITGMNKPVDVPIEFEYDVPPFEQRWVQVIPHVIDEYDSWYLAWGDAARERAEIPPPRLGDPAVVLLHNTRELPRSVGAIKRFPVDLFPPSVTATDSLDAVVLDTSPELQGARLQAFLEWIRRGGRVFLLQDDQGRYPQFPTALGALSTNADEFSVGSGRVRRLEKQAADIDPELLRETLMSRPPTLRNGRPDPQDLFSVYGGATGWDRHRPILSDLEAASRFYRRWWLIYPLSLLYLASIFPASYLVGRNSPKMRWFFATFLGAAAAFSVAFATLGRVGTGERNRIRSATIARQVSDNIFDVSQWAALGVIEGREFTVSHEASGRLYCTGSDEEQVNGAAIPGSSARLVVDIPPGSTRTVIARFRAESPPLQLKLDSLEFGEGRVQGLSVSGSGMPESLISAYAAYRENLYPLNPVANLLVADTHRPVMTSIYASALGEFDQRTKSFGWGGMGSSPVDPEEKTQEQLFEHLERRLIGNAFGLTNEVRRDSAITPPGQLRILLFAEDGKRFSISGEEFPDRRGCVLYVVDFPVSDR